MAFAKIRAARPIKMKNNLLLFLLLFFKGSTDTLSSTTSSEASGEYNLVRLIQPY